MALSNVLRDTIGLTGTKVGCEAETVALARVRLNGEQLRLVPAADA